MVSEVNLGNLIKIVEKYNPKGTYDIVRAYRFAEKKHKGQVRQSGQPYIIHPLSVACILAQMQADTDTICAGLLHDTIEDTNTTKEEIEILFNKDVANLVDGVTKFQFNNKEEENLANTRKIVSSMVDDVRVVIIKLADRLHNMRTIEFKSEEKQKENALETLEIFVPLANLIGLRRIKEELEDISFYCYNKDKYLELLDKREEFKNKSAFKLTMMKEDIKDILDKLNIANEEYINIKNIYGLYKREKYSSNLLDIHDVLSIKVCVDTEEECYKALGSIHKLYHPVNALFKDYICNPKANRYQSLHTTLFTGEDFLTQVRIRTYKMDEIASLGIAQYWKTNGESAKKRMQDSIESKFQFYKSLSEIENGKMSDEIYFDVVKNEVLNKKAHVFDINGNMIELPSGSHPIDFAARVLGDNILYLDYITVNNSIVDNNYQLQDNDILKLVLNYDKVTNLTNYSNNATTTYAKRLLKKQF